MTPSQLKKVLNENWGEGWLKNFKNFEVRPFAAASIGQVHKATLKSGETVAIKVQFPGVKKSIDNDLNTLKFIMKNSGMLPANFPLEYYISQCGELLRQETDYELEAANINNFSKYLENFSGLKVPKVYDELTTDQTITMSFLEGQELSSLVNFNQSKKDKIALSLIELLLNEIFIFKSVQTDPNLANFLVSKDDNSISVLDFGACCWVSDETYELYKGLLKVSLTVNVEKIKLFLEENNFVPRDASAEGTKFIDKIVATATEEISRHEVFDFQKSKVFELITEENLNLYLELIPSSVLGSDFIFIQRKILGLILFFRVIGARIPLLKILIKHSKVLDL
jgi:predicted unusual protein kinase regulating ubiquinone biosynthesis (AarF/ABC1/UbiB family)